MKSCDWGVESEPTRDASGTRTIVVFSQVPIRVEVSILTSRLSDFGDAETLALKKDRALDTLRLMLEQYIARNEVQPGQLTRIDENDVDLIPIIREMRERQDGEKQ